VHDQVWEGDEMSEYKNCPVCGANDWHELTWLSVLPDRVYCTNCGMIVHKERINDRVIQWVPVGERLPKEEGEYCVVIKYKSGTEYTAIRSWMCDDVWYDDADETEYPVTHWLDDHTKWEEKS